MKSKVTLKGTKKRGYVLEVKDKWSWQEIALMEEDLREIVKLIKKKLKTFKS